MAGGSGTQGTRRTRTIAGQHCSCQFASICWLVPACYGTPAPASGWYFCGNGSLPGTCGTWTGTYCIHKGAWRHAWSADCTVLAPARLRGRPQQLLRSHCCLCFRGICQAGAALSSLQGSCWRCGTRGQVYRHAGPARLRQAEAAGCSAASSAGSGWSGSGRNGCRGALALGARSRGLLQQDLACLVCRVLPESMAAINPQPSCMAAINPQPSCHGLLPAHHGQPGQRLASH